MQPFCFSNRASLCERLIFVMMFMEHKALRIEYKWTKLAFLWVHLTHMKSWKAFMRHIKRFQDEKDGDHLRSEKAFMRHIKRGEEVDALKPDLDVRDLIEVFAANYLLERAAHGLPFDSRIYNRI